MTFAMLACLPATEAIAAEPPPLDVEFLDYLANCESKDDNWTVVAGRKPQKKSPEKDAPPPKPPGTDAQPTEKQP